jgi:hypothetical protein
VVIRLGHSVAVAERHYLGVHRGIRRDARTLEAVPTFKPPPLAQATIGSGRSSNSRR